MVDARYRLFALTGATGRAEASTAYVTPDQLKRVEKLTARFDLHLGLKRIGSVRPSPDGAVPLPNAITPAWYELYASRWRLLNPLYYRRLVRHVSAADAVLVIMPVLEGIPTLLIGRVLRKPTYMMLVAPSFGFRISEGDRSAFRRLQGRALVNLAGLFARRILTQGESLTREFVSSLRNKMVVTLQTTLEEADFAEIPHRRRGALDLLMVCRLVRTKRVDVAIRAVELLAEKGVDARLVLVGDGPERPMLAALAARSTVADRVTFLGYLGADALRARYRSAFAFVLPSETEGISLAVMEAMAAGTPVIATAAGGLRELLEDGVDALVIRPDAFELAGAVQRLAGDPDLHKSLATAAQRKMRSGASDAWVERLWDLVREDSARRSRST